MIQNENIKLKRRERIDDLQRNGYHIIQNSDMFCFGMDAVLLSGFVKVKRGAAIVDLGTGTGILPILLSAKTHADKITGLEIEPKSVDMARRSVIMNGLEEKISIVEGDIKNASEILGKGTFDTVVCNPPYSAEMDGALNPELHIAIARHEILCSFDDVGERIF